MNYNMHLESAPKDKERKKRDHLKDNSTRQNPSYSFNKQAPRYHSMCWRMPQDSRQCPKSINRIIRNIGTEENKIAK